MSVINASLPHHEPDCWALAKMLRKCLDKAIAPALVLAEYHPSSRDVALAALLWCGVSGVMSGSPSRWPLIEADHRPDSTRRHPPQLAADDVHIWCAGLDLPMSTVKAL